MMTGDECFPQAVIWENNDRVYAEKNYYILLPGRKSSRPLNQQQTKWMKTSMMRTTKMIMMMMRMMTKTTMTGRITTCGLGIRTKILIFFTFFYLTNTDAWPDLLVSIASVCVKFSSHNLTSPSDLTNILSSSREANEMEDEDE